MQSRQVLLEDLINFSSPLNEILLQLKNYCWDCDVIWWCSRGAIFNLFCGAT